jgi:hypothetical protein
MTLALEINDAGLILAAEGMVLAESPGYAMLDGPRVVVGALAAGRARLAPLHAENRYWRDLGTASLPRPTAAARTAAELAHAQLEDLVRPWLQHGPELLVAVPEWYTREQLALLLGIAQEAGLQTVGLVDAGLAACSLEPAPSRLVHLELTLYSVVLTALEHAGELRRTRYELLPQHGWIALQQAWLERIADAFVRKTRFDPLHEAATEQRLCDALPQWMAALGAGPVARIEIAAGAAQHAIEIDSADGLAAVERIYDEYARTVQRARGVDGTLNLRLSHRLAALPGLEDRLAGLRDCSLQRVPRGAAALGALAHESSLRRDPGALVLLQRLAVPRQTGPTDASAALRSRVPEPQRPTHLLLDGHAYSMAGRPLTLGSDVPAGRRALRVAAGPGISRVHCTVAAGMDGAWLEDHSTFGSFVNGERAGGRVELRIGDRLRIGNPGIECALLRVVDDDG